MKSQSIYISPALTWTMVASDALKILNKYTNLAGVRTISHVTPQIKIHKKSNIHKNLMMFRQKLLKLNLFWSIIGILWADK